MARKRRSSNAEDTADLSIITSFWLFGLFNNVLYVIILSAALDLVGPNVPKGIVLLADNVPSLIGKATAPYFIHRISYGFRIIIFALLSASGMILIASSPSYEDGGAIPIKLCGIALASLSSGVGELSFLGLTHFYGSWSLAAWGSGTGAAGLVGAGLYSLFVTVIGLQVRTTLAASALLPAIMVFTFFLLLPMPGTQAVHPKSHPRMTGSDDDAEGFQEEHAGLLDGPSATPSILSTIPQNSSPTFRVRLRRLRSLFFPFMLPLFAVYFAEYTINLALFPTLLFPLKSTPFSSYSSFYPTYSLLYQVGVFISRSSLPVVRIPPSWLYPFSFLQYANFTVLLLQALYNLFGNIFGERTTLYLTFAIIIWEGLLGGLVYVNTFEGIREKYAGEEREWCLGATTVSDSAGIAIAGIIASVIETSVCAAQVRKGIDWCTKM